MIYTCKNLNILQIWGKEHKCSSLLYPPSPSTALLHQRQFSTPCSWCVKNMCWGAAYFWYIVSIKMGSLV